MGTPWQKCWTIGLLLRQKLKLASAKAQPILMSQHVISIREIIAIALTMARRTDFVDRPAPVDGLSTEGCDPETICCPNMEGYEFQGSKGRPNTRWGLWS